MLKRKHSCIKEVRGVGLLCALEFESSIDPKTLGIVHKNLFDTGFIVGLKLAANVIRFYPPLIVEHYMIDAMVEALDTILNDLSRCYNIILFSA